MARFYYIVNCYTLFQNQNEVNWQFNLYLLLLSNTHPNFSQQRYGQVCLMMNQLLPSKAMLPENVYNKKNFKENKKLCHPDKHFWCAMSLWTSYLTMLSINVSYKWFDQVSRKFGLFWPVLKCTVKITSERIIYSSQWPCSINRCLFKCFRCLHFSHCFYHNQGQRKITK